MLKFLRESVKEFDHVVWPTRAETKKYLTIVLSVIASLTIILFALGSAFTSSLFALRDAIVPASSTTTSQTSTQSPIDLSSLQFSTGSSASGATAKAVIASGVTTSTGAQK